MCIGIGPLGVLAIGALSEQLGPFVAIFIMACLVVGLNLVWIWLFKDARIGSLCPCLKDSPGGGTGVSNPRSP